MLSSGNIAGKIIVDTSTVHPDTAAKASEQLAVKGVQFVSSPVFGASTMAAAGKLIFAMAGPNAALEKVKPLVLNVMGRSIIELGQDVKKSSLLKISGFVVEYLLEWQILIRTRSNVIVISLMEVISEAQVFAEKTNLGTATMERLISDMFGPVAKSYSQRHVSFLSPPLSPRRSCTLLIYNSSRRLTTGAYAPPLHTPPGFAVSLAIKDAKHAISIANGVDMHLPALQLALGHMLDARSFAGESLDSSSMYGTMRAESGLSFWSEGSRQGN